jgi:hypothetical protein
MRNDMSKSEPVKASMNLADMTLEQLVQLSQGLGHDLENLRAQRQYLRKHIDNRLAQGERTSIELREPDDGEVGGDAKDANAAGAVINVTKT